MSQFPGMLLHKKLSTLVSEAIEHHDLVEAYHESDLLEQLPESDYSERTELVEAPNSRIWLIQVDTPGGHLHDRMTLVTGKERDFILEEASSSDSGTSDNGGEDYERSGDEMEENGTTAVKKEQKQHLLAINSLMVAPTAEEKEEETNKDTKAAAVKVSIVQLMETDEPDDPALNIPMFAPFPDAPPPVVEITPQEAKELEENRVKARKDVRREEIMVKEKDGGSQIKIFAKHVGEEVEDLLEGFGSRRKQKKGSKFTSFVKRKKPAVLVKLGKRFTRKKKDQGHIIIDDDSTF